MLWSKFKLNAMFTNAVSVGSPDRLPSFAIFVSLHNIFAYITFCNSKFSFTLLSFSISSLTSFISLNLSLKNIFSTVILFCVKVPVLSEHITVLLPNVSTAGNLFTIAFFLTIFCTPIAKTIVDTAAKPSGIAATASDTAVINIFIGSFPSIIPAINIIIHIAIAAIPNVLLNLFNFFCKGVSCFSVLFIIPAILPTSVVIPVSTTIPFPLPYVTKLDENSIFVLSPTPTSVFSIFSILFSTGTDSPVSELSCDFKFTASITLKSAGI